MYDKIAFVKTGWSDFYEGGLVLGRHGYLTKNKEGHECFNFFKSFDGYYYGYLPPIGPESASPKVQDRSGWLVIFVAARGGHGPLTVVGWYKNATFEKSHGPRPEYAQDRNFETDQHGNEFTYCVKSQLAVRVPTAERTTTIAGNHFRRSPIVYVRGTTRKGAWRTKLARQAVSLLKDFDKTSSAVQYKDAENQGFPLMDSAKRKKIERKAVNLVKQYYRDRGYLVTDKQPEKCGYDLLVSKTSTLKELHVEVKGTSLSTGRFFITANEREYSKQKKWRLAVVTDVLDRPNLRIYTRKTYKAIFRVNPIVWAAIEK